MTKRTVCYDLHHIFHCRILIVLVFDKLVYMKKLLAVTSLFTLLLPLFASAHPGHGEGGGYTIIHYFAEPQHAIVSISLLLMIVVYVRMLRHKREPK